MKIKMKSTVALIFLIIFGLVKSELFSGCPISPVIKDFDPSRYAGKWYDIEKLSMGFESKLKCIYAIYTPVNGSFVQVQNNGLITETNSWNTINGYAYVPNRNSPNHLLVVLKVPIANFFIENTGKYDIWATDYETYSLIHSCQLIPPKNTKVDSVYILSRAKVLEPSILNNLKNILSSNGFDISRLTVSTQDCDV